MRITFIIIAKSIALVAAVGILALALWIGYTRMMQYFDFRFFESRFSALTGVADVKYSEYEGHRRAELELHSGGFILLEQFARDVFEKPFFMGLGAIGDVEIYCAVDAPAGSSGRSTRIYEGFNLIHYAENNQLSVKNIQDLVERYDAALTLIKTNLGESGGEHVVLRTMGNGDSRQIFQVKMVCKSVGRKIEIGK